MVAKLALGGEGATTLIDCPGLRAHRPSSAAERHVPCLTNNACFFFVVSLSDFDEKLAEDPSTNRLAESLTLFGEALADPNLADTPIVLLLNKLDLFKEKLAGIEAPHVYDGLPDAIVDEYTDDRTTLHNERKALRFITSIFREKVEESTKPEKELHIITLAAGERGKIASIADLYATKIVSADAEAKAKAASSPKKKGINAKLSGTTG